MFGVTAHVSTCTVHVHTCIIRTQARYSDTPRKQLNRKERNVIERQS
ncbi:uncharacterized protein BDCG_17028 [Blastomyces dermatitidis ER-3]|uniref:Uncharacterized protein n=2 Tax=Ajellomyces dermatitidis TaxID=5039 RepID=A0A0J9ER69_AJEDA|nr:uncharacterized protein BDCG_17028 [Blastomyces dermatitidis ER-3]EEQ89742.2 hypothetical protein BDCG_17028 [Blastomyces dermatitidis ER-3]KMW68798.1 hypothetical protein BDDG_13037 [Blastomyces dermatitidis ATCC 18188]